MPAGDSLDTAADKWNANPSISGGVCYNRSRNRYKPKKEGTFMEPKLQALCEQFILNRDRVKQTQKLSSSYLPPVCAPLYCTQGKTVDEERLKVCQKLIKEKTGVFSNFRGIMEMAFACMLALEEEPETALKNALSAYNLLKKEFTASQYLPLAAFLLKDEADVNGIIARGREIYQTMRKEHPFLTSTEDSVFAVLMAFSDKDNDALIEDMEACYTLLKERFNNGNSVQAVSHVLAMAEGTPEEKTGKLFDLFDALRRSGLKYSKYYELATLAALSTLPVDVGQMAMDMLDVDAWLSGQKGYGFWGTPKATRLMHATMIVSNAYTSNLTLSTAAFAGTLTMVISQQIATMAAIAGANAAITAANS